MQEVRTTQASDSMIRWYNERQVNSMTSTITFCMDNPIMTKGSDWMADHVGRASVGRMQRPGYYEILAYSDNKADFPELSRMARREKNATYIKSIISEGVTALD